MKHSLLFRFCLVSTLLISLYSCSSKSEDFLTEPLTDYVPLVKGKYITYRLDSLVFTDFNRNPETHSYQVKHVVDDSFVDNLGRPSVRMYRYIRDSSGTQDWQPNGSYYITVTDNQVEVVEDNLRFLKLHAPIREGYSWKGNKYLPTDTYESFGYAFSINNSIKNWDYVYAPFEPTLTFRNKTYTDVQTVEEEDYADNVPITSPTEYANRTRAVEKYSKNIGLVYREYELWEYQPNSGPNPFYIGFGIKLWMIDHN